MDRYIDHNIRTAIYQRDRAMQISVTDAKTVLTDLVRRAEAGDEVILTRHGHAVVRFVRVAAAPDAKARRKVIEKVMRATAKKIDGGPSAARSQDFLYDDDGLPG